MESPPKAYAAIFLDSDNRDLLLRWWAQSTGVELLSKVYADHVTLAYDLSPEEQALVATGQAQTVLVTGWAADERGQAVSVTGPFKSRNAFPHITMATNDVTGAVYSNELLARGPILPAPELLLRGTVEVRWD